MRWGGLKKGTGKERESHSERRNPMKIPAFWEKYSKIEKNGNPSPTGLG